MKQKALHSILVKPAGPDCNMECAYCFYSGKRALFPAEKAPRMSDAVLEETIRQVLQQSSAHVSFAWQGGEPTLMGLPFFQKAVNWQKRFGFGTGGKSVGNGLQTNGLTIDDRWVRFLLENEFLVGISLDGPEHVHDHYRRCLGGGGSWSRVVKSARRLLEAGVAVNAVMVVSDYSARFAEEMYAFQKELGLHYMQFIPCLETDAINSAAAAPFSVSAEAYGDCLCRVFDLWFADFTRAGPLTSIRFFDSLFHSYVGLEPPECTLLEECGNYVVVEHTGDVYSCDFFVEPATKLGNIMESSITAMLNSEAQVSFGRRKSVLPDECARCRWLCHCRCGCLKDRIHNPADPTRNFFCAAFRKFFAHADERLRRLAEEWSRSCHPTRQSLE